MATSEGPPGPSLMQVQLEQAEKAMTEPNNGALLQINPTRPYAALAKRAMVERGPNTLVQFVHEPNPKPGSTVIVPVPLVPAYCCPSGSVAMVQSSITLHRYAGPYNADKQLVDPREDPATLPDDFDQFLDAAVYELVKLSERAISDPRDMRAQLKGSGIPAGPDGRWTAVVTPRELETILSVNEKCVEWLDVRVDRTGRANGTVVGHRMIALGGGLPEMRQGLKDLIRPWEPLKWIWLWTAAMACMDDRCGARLEFA